MEYASKISNTPICDLNFMRYVGWEESNDCIKKYFSQDTVDIIARKVTELTLGVDPKNRPIVVPDTTICGIMSEVYQSYRPPTGDIYGRYNVPSGTGPESYVQNMIDQTIEIITSDIRNNLEMEENNRKLTIWTTVYGDFNEHGLRAHPPIKVLNKRPNPMEFHMRY
jgi:hypothetical protein